MSYFDNELRDLREKNNELVQKVQYWKVTAAQKETENIELLKQLNELQYKLNVLKNVGETQSAKLDSALQKTSEEVLSHLVQASSGIANTMELVKSYMLESQELHSSLPNWSTIGNSTSEPKKINKVGPTFMGGKPIHPIVLVERMETHRANRRPVSSPSHNNNVSERALPMRMLLDVYIPLTRIDADTVPVNHEESDADDHGNYSPVDLDPDGDGETVENDDHVSEAEDIVESRHLGTLDEVSNVEEENETPERRLAESPLEGPSWLLDRPNDFLMSHGMNQEQTRIEDTGEQRPGAGAPDADVSALGESATEPATEFSPTVRRRRVASPAPPTTAHSTLHTPRLSSRLSPRLSPRPSPYFSSRARRLSGSVNDNRRILKVLVAKMHFNESERSNGDGPQPRLSTNTATKLSLTPQHVASPTLPVPRTPKRRRLEGAGHLKPVSKKQSVDTPSPNGSTDARVIVMESTSNQSESTSSGVSRQQSVADRRRHASRDSVESSGDSELSGEMLSDSRPRRRKRTVVYKEKPLNRKMRR